MKTTSVWLYHRDTEITEETANEIRGYNGRTFFLALCTLCLCGWSALAGTNLNSITLSGWVVVTNSTGGGSGGGTNYPAGAIYVDDSLTGSHNVGTNWADAYTNLASVVATAGQTVVISGGSVSQTYTFTASGAADDWIFAVGASNNPVTYEVGQDSGHNGIVIMNGGAVSGSGGAGNLSDHTGAPNFVTLNGNYGGASHLVFTNFSQQPMSYVTATGMVVRYTTFFGQAVWTAGHLMELDHDNFQPVAGGNFESVKMIDPNPQEYMDNFIHDCTFNELRQATYTNGSPAWVDCNNVTNPVFSGCGDIGIYDVAGCTISNCTFFTTAVTNYTANGHNDAVHTGGPFVRVIDCTISDMENLAIYFEFQTGSGHDMQAINNVIYRTDANVTNANNTWDIQIGLNGANSSTCSNLLVMNNTLVDGDDGISIGAPITSSYSNNWIVNNLIINEYGIACGSGGTTNEVLCLANKVLSSNGVAGANLTRAGVTSAIGIVPTNTVGPANGASVTFVSYIPYAPTNNFHLAANDVGATGNGTNWPSTYFKADKDGKPRPAATNWDIGAYQR